MKCERCGSDEITEDAWRHLRRFTCRCGFVWKENEMKENSICWNCGNWQHIDARKRYWQRIIGCWYCGELKKKDERKNA